MSRWTDNFDSVVKRYNDTTPIRGKRKAEDLRPISDRRYTWMRIEKISDTMYALHDGMWTWGNRADLATLLAPIIWERKEDGDYITIHNCSDGSYAVSRYNFLYNYLPSSMHFHYANDGKHWVKVNGKDHYLPKFKAKWLYTHTSQSSFEMVEHNKLVFKHTPEGFVRANELQPMKTRRINKDDTTRYDPKVAEIFTWMQAVMPILGTAMNDYTVRNEYANALCNGGSWYWKRYVEPELVREILDNDEHDKRMPFAVMCAYECNMFDSTGRFAPDNKSLSQLKQLMRKIGGMYTTELL